jgi:hypothetical protein
MLAGTIVIEKNAGSQFGAALRGGDLVCKGSVGGRTGVDQKGGTIIVGGDTGAFTGFMMQRGRMVICGNAGKNLGDSMYDGTIYLGGEPRSLGVDAVWAELTAGDREWLARKLAIYDMLPARGLDHFRKIVAGKQLWNYDNLEPSEKKRCCVRKVAEWPGMTNGGIPRRSPRQSWARPRRWRHWRRRRPRAANIFSGNRASSRRGLNDIHQVGAWPLPHARLLLLRRSRIGTT